MERDPAPALIPRSPTNVACGLVLAAGALLFVAQGLFEDGGLRAVQDHVITHSFSRQVAETHEYHRDFTYPLPAVILKLMLGWPGMAVSSVLWSAASLAALAALILALVVLLGDRGSERALLAPTLACVIWVWCVQWDLRAVNVNLVFSALALWGLVRAGQGRTLAAGALLAASVALKLYSAPLILYLAWRGWWRELLATTLFGLAFFVLVPILYFGPGDAVTLTALWLKNVQASLMPGFVLELTAYKVSVEWVLLSFMSDGVAGGDGIYLALRIGQLGVVVGVVAHLWLDSRSPNGRAAGERLLVDAGLILGATVLLSPLAEPHHGVVALLPASVLAHIALDPGRERTARIVAGGVLALCAAVLEAAPSGPWKAAAFTSALGLTLLTLSLLRRR